MSAVLTRRRPSRARDRDAFRGSQERLFAGVGAAPPDAVPAEPRVYREPAAPGRESEPGGHREPRDPDNELGGCPEPHGPETELGGCREPHGPETELRAYGEPAATTGQVAAPVVAGPTLEEAITGLWDALLAEDAAACPVCGSAMQPRHSAAAGVVGGRCGACEATLS